MNLQKIALVSGVLLTAGVIVAVSAPGPGGGEPGRWGGFGREGGAGGPRGWFGPRSMTADQYDTRTRERFARLDKNSDGVLDAAEIEAALADRHGRGHGPRAGRSDQGRSDQGRSDQGRGDQGRGDQGRGDQGRGDQGRGGQGEGERFLRQFGDKDGKVTKDAFLSEAKRRFAELDLNNDGKITDDDLPPMMRGKGILKANGPAPQGPMARLITRLRTADANQDGIITRDAFVAVETKRFDSLDRNKDGVVDKADFDLVRKEMTDYQVKRFLHAYGADADGKVTRDQYYKVAKERFARLDRKGEGRITFGPPEGQDRGGGWFGRRGRGEAQPGAGPDGGPDGPPSDGRRGPPPRG